MLVIDRLKGRVNSGAKGGAPVEEKADLFTRPHPGRRLRRAACPVLGVAVEVLAQPGGGIRLGLGGSGLLGRRTGEVDRLLADAVDGNLR